MRVNKETEAERVAGYMAQTTGSDTFYRHALMPDIKWTEGVQFVADTCSAHWLVDLIVSHQLNDEVARELFQVWTLRRFGNSWIIQATDGDKGDGPIEIARQEIPYSDFPVDLSPFTLYLEGSTIMLPRER